MNGELTHEQTAVADALERERLVARVSERFRSELDLDLTLETAVREAGRALGAIRTFVRLGGAGDPGKVEALWHVEGVQPLGDTAGQLTGSNLAARTRRTIAITDVATATELDEAAPGGREILLGMGTRSLLAAPIVVLRELIGVLGLHRAEPGPWSQPEVLLAEALAREVGLAVHTARMLEEKRRHLDQTAALFKAAQVLTSDLRLEPVLQRLVLEVTGLLEADAADCYLLDERRGTLRCAAAIHLDPALVEWEFPADQGLAAHALRRHRCVFSHDYPQSVEPVPHAAYREFASSLVAPMMWSGETRGVLGAATRDPGRRFSQADAEVLEAFASLASLALRNAASFEESVRRTRIQRAFYRIAAVLGRPLSLGETMNAVAQAAGEALGGSYAALLMPARSGLALAGSRDLPEPLRDALAEDPPEPVSALAEAARDRRILASSKVEGDDRFPPAWRAALRESGCRSLLSVPIHDDSGEAGLVLVFFADERGFADEDLDLASHLAGAAEGALERSRLYEGERSSRALAEELARTGSLLASELDPQAVLDEVARQAPALLAADACVIRVVEGEELVVRAAAGEGADHAHGARAPASGWPPGDVVQSHAPIAVPDAGEQRPDERDPLRRAGYRAQLAVPLTGPEGEVQGVLSLYARQPRTWRPDEIAALQALAASASAALSNAELYQRVAVEKERSVAILANIADGIVATDREGRVLLWNHAAERITGIPPSEALGRTPAQLLQRNLSSDGDAPLGDRIVSIPRGSEEVWLSLTEAVMRDPTGDVAGRIFAFRDISAEHVVEQMKSDFVSTVSQELRRPLTSIYGFAATLLRHDLLFGEDERRTFLTYISSESERLTKIVDSLLAVARLDSGDVQLRLAPVDVRPVVSEVVMRAREDSGQFKHSFVIDLPPEPLSANADRASLERVLANLVDNAVKYSQGGTRVTVAARRKSNTVELTVADEGVGIPQSEQHRIFTKFYRGSQPAGGEGNGGPGLSLFIARGLVTAMGGSISVSSSEGEGSSFVLELPLA